MITFPDYSGVWEQITREFDCTHEASEVRRRVTRTNARTFYRQCVQCGRNMGQCATSTLVNPDSCPPFDEDINIEWLRERQKRLHELKEQKTKEYEEQKAQTEAQIELQRIQSRNNYKKYIHSDEWARKRNLVLKRDNYTCQACLINKASDIHHRTYENLGNELMWELVSVCRGCHERIHNKPI